MKRFENIVRDVAFRRPIVQEGGRSRPQVSCHGEFAVCIPRSCSDNSKFLSLGETKSIVAADVTLFCQVGWCSAMKDILHQWTQLVVMLSPVDNSETSARQERGPRIPITQPSQTTNHCHLVPPGVNPETDEQLAIPEPAWQNERKFILTKVFCLVLKHFFQDTC